MASSTLGLISGSTIAPVSVDDIIGTSSANPVLTKSRVADSDSIAPRAATASPDLATVAMMLPPLGDFGPVADRSSRAKLQSAAETGLVESARDTSTSVGKYLGDPKHQALVAGGIGAFAAVQALPGVDGATDAAVGAVGAAMYASAGPEHKANIGKALGEFKQYATGAVGATSPSDLHAAAHHFAAFLEIGGPEAADALGTLAGSASEVGRYRGESRCVIRRRAVRGRQGSHERRRGGATRCRCRESLARRRSERSRAGRQAGTRSRGRRLGCRNRHARVSRHPASRESGGVVDSCRGDRDGSPQHHGSRCRGRPHHFKAR